jgi:hypothetical protein
MVYLVGGCSCSYGYLLMLIGANIFWAARFFKNAIVSADMEDFGWGRYLEYHCWSFTFPLPESHH